MNYTLETNSKITGQRCYYDGYGFALRREDARIFYTAHKWAAAEEHAANVSAAFNGHEVEPCEA